MIFTLIDKPINLSTEAVFGLIENYLRGKYKVVSLSDKELVIKKIHNYQSNGWEIIMKRLHSYDLVCFKMLDNSIRFEVVIWKQIFVLLVFLLFGFVISWTLWELSFGTSLLIPSIPVLIIIAVRYFEIRRFINREKAEISRRIDI